MGEEPLLPGPEHLHDLHLLGDSLTEKQLECFELVCERGLGMKDTRDDQEQIIFQSLYEKLPKDDALKLLRLFLDRIRYSTRNEAIKTNILLPVMKKSDKDALCRSTEEYQKFDMWLTLAAAMTSMSNSSLLCKSDYQKLEKYHRRRTLTHIAQDRIASPCHLLKLIDDQSPFKPDSLNKVLKWFRDCGLSYPKEIVDYQKRHSIRVPIHWEICYKRTCYSSFGLSIFTVPGFICILLFLTIPNYPLVTNDVSDNHTFVGGKATVKIGNYSSKSIKDLQIEALNDMKGYNYANGTVIDAVQENEFHVSFKELDFESRPYGALSDEVPVFLAFNQSVSLYNAAGEGKVNISFDLTNINRASCAARLVVFSSQVDFTNYTGSTRDPRHVPLAAYHSSGCINTSGIHSVPLKEDAFSFFAIAHVKNISLTVNTSGYISEYVILEKESSCTLNPSCQSNITISSEEKCTTSRDDDDSADDEIPYVTVFGTSTSSDLGEVRVTAHHLCHQEYNYWYFAAGVIPGVVSSLLLVVFGVSCLVCLYKCIFRAKEMQVV
ncbi:PREDICTED: uncharacterized protein LOC109585864 [Amphimedon queenslandica]|uniref:Death domain-containing protein n=1 Tax=Amphimedon queenslandica TaxID=400682 RepID=A0A1X7TUR0_AMPQE|nr:PREDICTED: uncharacterized protein LOC109585864 [Amphimedon queenslandica]|eukprot:XP_019857572.1 PREDICTED: uncharacterized protein LOC109585864 [Amphimedon queenslandica]